jgi:NAD(P)H-hydrate epimerase
MTDDLPRLPERPPESHKGDFGMALVVGGSRGMSGAVALAGMAALRGGAGLVRLAVPEPCLETVAGFEPSYMTVPLPADRAGRIALAARERIVSAAKGATVVAFGPGLGRSPGLNALTAWLYTHLPQTMVIDADGLTALAARRETLGRPAAARILTPHPGEFARLLDVARVPAEQRESAAVELAARWGVVVVLKGHRTLITDGVSRAINTTGNPGMATGGSGDVLTGLVTALACQGLAPFDAARMGVFLHGLAGDLAASELGQEAMIASDLIRFLPKAFQEYRKQYPA